MPNPEATVCMAVHTRQSW